MDHLVHGQPRDMRAVTCQLHDRAAMTLLAGGIRDKAMGILGLVSCPIGLMMNYREIITTEPGKRGGNPCIRGMHITVYEVLDYLASGMSPQQILADFPDLTAEDIEACLAYAADRERTQFTVGT